MFPLGEATRDQQRSTAKSQAILETSHSRAAAISSLREVMPWTATLLTNQIPWPCLHQPRVLQRLCQLRHLSSSLRDNGEDLDILQVLTHGPHGGHSFAHSSTRSRDTCLATPQKFCSIFSFNAIMAHVMSKVHSGETKHRGRPLSFT